MAGDSTGREFEWELCPELDRFLGEVVAAFLEHNRVAARLAERMLEETSTRFIDWIDHVVLPRSKTDPARLKAAGLEVIQAPGAAGGMRLFAHPRSYLFPLLVGENAETEICLKPEELDHFLRALGSGVAVEGEPFAPLRRAAASREGGYVLSAVERRGYGGFVVEKADDLREYADVLSAFFRRKRLFDHDEEGLERTQKLVDTCLRRLKRERVCDAFIRTERAYWQRRNRAGQIQRARQDGLGLGWGNHDHHTYRSSRENFAALVRLFVALGFAPRETYYPGAGAGWGAQVLEHEVCRTVLFTDVDLSPDEARVDFPRVGLAHRKELGTVGLWVGLHGESLLQAGLHHLAARFDFERLRGDLEQLGAKVMPPFSYFDSLKQAFTVGEVWQPGGSRLDRLLAQSSITRDQFERFAGEGALGGHLENLERNQGFKGFNQSAVTRIIQATDPRVQAAPGA